MASYGWDELWYALEQSVKLQAHYAELLNMHDGGQRMIFKTPEEWLKRLRFLEKEQAKNARRT